MRKLSAALAVVMNLTSKSLEGEIVGERLSTRKSCRQLFETLFDAKDDVLQIRVPKNGAGKTNELELKEEWASCASALIFMLGSESAILRASLARVAIAAVSTMVDMLKIEERARKMLNSGVEMCMKLVGEEYTNGDVGFYSVGEGLETTQNLNENLTDSEKNLR
ncbi:hypothetical protein EDD18DRAFT_1106814 [Armillaria luteobubalina]|uniref:Uncharacterized protein n=1 Tax=Armillaria luteobubalina TaxID=153913 RepID=A0AA39Q2M1_9AGAR|nr:hypothetical protein EDD18DRAFT_1106814 [Armillaria luteobubalina]